MGRFWKDFDKIYKILNIKFDVISGESLYNGKMEKSIQELKAINDTQAATITTLTARIVALENR